MLHGSDNYINLSYFEAYSITQIIQLFTCLFPVENFLLFSKSTENIKFETRLKNT